MRVLLIAVISVSWSFQASANEKFRWPDRIVLCSETSEINAHDVKPFIKQVFPERPDIEVVTGDSAKREFNGDTRYVYEAGDEDSRTLQRCILSFPPVEGGIVDKIQEVRSSLNTRPAAWDDIPGSQYWLPLERGTSYFYGTGWVMAISATVYGGDALRSDSFITMFGLDDGFCSDFSRCSIRQRVSK